MLRLLREQQNQAANQKTSTATMSPPAASPTGQGQAPPIPIMRMQETEGTSGGAALGHFHVEDLMEEEIPEETVSFQPGLFKAIFDMEESDEGETS